MTSQLNHSAKYISFRRNGDISVLVDVAYTCDRVLNAYLCHQLAALIRIEASIKVLAVVPTESSVMLLFEQPIKQINTIFNAVLVLFNGCIRYAKDFVLDSPVIELPACYELKVAPDMPLVSQLTGLTTTQVVQQHSAVTYVISMLGFLPGFAYMLGSDKSLHIPRKATPNIKIPAGSIAIAAEYTGIYPTHSPGGWYCIGRTPISLFDMNKSQPNKLKPFDRIKFKPISYVEFVELQTVR